MKLLERIKLSLGIESYSDRYARTNGFKIVKVKNIGYDLYRGDKLISKFSSELSALQEIYRLNTWGVDD